MASATQIHARAPVPLWARLLSVPVLIVVLLAGLWFFAGVVAPGYDSSIGFAVGWFIAAYLGLRLVRRPWPSLNRWLQLTFLATAATVAFVFAWTTFRDKVVNEQVVSAGGGNVTLSSGGFVGVAHGASGTASIVRLASGERKLVFIDLRTDNGPDLRVYLVQGPVDGNGSGKDFRDLGGLKGNIGTQQYKIPQDLDVRRYSTVVIWCRAFTVGFAKAELKAS